MFKRIIYYFMISIVGILYSQDIPPEFEQDFKIDYEKMFDKIVYLHKLVTNLN